MRIRGWLFSLAIAWLLAGCGGGSDAPRPIPTAQIQAVLDSHVNDSSPGLLCAVLTPAERWSGAAGMAEIATQTPMSPGMQVRVGSITKQFIAAVVLQLRDEGQLALTEKLC